MKRLLACVAAMAVCLVLVFAGVGAGAVVRADSGQVITGEIIEMRKTDDAIVIEGHYVRKELCLRLTFTLTHLYPSAKIELRNGYAKYKYSSELWASLGEIENDNYSLWASSEYRNFKNSAQESDFMFWMTDTCTFTDKYNRTFTFLATQYTGEDFTEEFDTVSAQNMSSATYDRYGNYTYDGVYWIMPVVKTQSAKNSVSTLRIAVGNLVIDVEMDETGWHIVNKGNLVCKVKCGSTTASDYDNMLYYDYPPTKDYHMKRTINFGAVETVSLRDRFIVTLAGTTVVGTEFIKDTSAIGFKSDDGSKMIAYFAPSSGKVAGWYVGSKTSTQAVSALSAGQAGVDGERLGAFARTSNIATYASAEFDGFTFTKANVAPQVVATDYETTKFSAFLKANSISLPSAGVAQNTANLVVPICCVAGALVASVAVMAVLVKKKYE